MIKGAVQYYRELPLSILGKIVKSFTPFENPANPAYRQTGMAWMIFLTGFTQNIL